MEPLFPERSCEICGGTMTNVSDTEAVCTSNETHKRKLTTEPKKPIGNPKHLGAVTFSTKKAPSKDAGR